MIGSPTVLLAGALAASLAVGAAWLHGKGVGWDQRDVKCMQDAEAARIAAEKKVEAIRDAGLEQSQRYEDKLRDIEARHARTSRTLRNALAQPVICPTSGVVGDVLIPAGAVAGMFNREPAPAGPAASGPAPAEPVGPVR